MNWTEGIAILGLIVAIVGYFIKYLIDVRLAQRKDRLERINRQLNEFYGPLLAHARSSDESWRAFREQCRPGEVSYWQGNPPPTKAEVLTWRLWMTTIFVPVHQRMRDLVLSHADLIDEADMPTSLLTLCAHVAGYQAVLKRWESGEISLAREDNVSVVNYPSHELAAYAAAAFARLKAEQCALLGSTIRESSVSTHRLR